MSLVQGTSGAGEGPEFRGVTYDTLTHQKGPVASAQVDRIATRNLEGNLNIAGHTLPLGELEFKKSRGHSKKFGKVYDSPQYIKDNQPLEVEVNVSSDSVTGLVTRPSGEFGRLGFILIEDASNKRDSIPISPDPKWVNSGIQFDIPERGVPRDSSINHLSEVLSESREVDQYE